MTLKTGNLDVIKINRAGISYSLIFIIDIPISELEGSFNPIQKIKFIHSNVAYRVCKDVNKKIVMNYLKNMLHLGFRQIKIIKKNKVYRIEGYINIMDKFCIINEEDIIEPLTFAILAKITYKRYLKKEWGVECD